MHIYIDTIAHSEQRYPTVGDWQFTAEGGGGQRSTPVEGPVLHVAVSEMKNVDYEFLVGLHEMIEAYLCHKRGIREEDITAFDKAFEASRPKGNIDEPGDHILAPYRKEHFFATSIERLVAAELSVDWTEYDKTVVNL
jgi:hypothetical protein